MNMLFYFVVISLALSVIFIKCTDFWFLFAMLLKQFWHKEPQKTDKILAIELIFKKNLFYFFGQGGVGLGTDTCFKLLFLKI